MMKHRDKNPPPLSLNCSVLLFTENNQHATTLCSPAPTMTRCVVSVGTTMETLTMTSPNQMAPWLEMSMTLVIAGKQRRTKMNCELNRLISGQNVTKLQVLGRAFYEL